MTHIHKEFPHLSESNYGVTRRGGAGSPGPLPPALPPPRLHRLVASRAAMIPAERHARAHATIPPLLGSTLKSGSFSGTHSAKY